MDIRDLIDDSAFERLRRQTERFDEISSAITHSATLQARIDDVARIGESFGIAHEAAIRPILKVADQIRVMQEQSVALFKGSEVFTPRITFNPPQIPVVEPPVPESRKVIAWINNELIRRTAELPDPAKQSISLVLTLPGGRQLYPITIEADGDSMLVIEGYDVDGELHQETTGAMSFGIDFGVVDIKPPKPDLRIVE